MTLTDNTKQHEELHRKYLELQMKQAQAVQPTYTSNVSLGAFSQLPPIVPDPPINLDEGAWDVPVSQLVDLWTVKYGSAWVPNEELDEFYSVAATRLSSLNKIERHNVNMKIVNRIVE
jgi:hypothetical protein